jgi:hypothetical protein
VLGERHGPSFCFLQADIQFPETFVEEAIFSLSYAFGTFVQKSVTPWIHIWVFYSVSLFFISVLCQYHAVFIAMALQYGLKLGIVIPPASLVLLFIALCSQMNFRVDFSISVTEFLCADYLSCYVGCCNIFVP